jgi:hypothetical protein
MIPQSLFQEVPLDPVVLSDLIIRVLRLEATSVVPQHEFLSSRIVLIHDELKMDNLLTLLSLSFYLCIDLLLKHSPLHILPINADYGVICSLLEVLLDWHSLLIVDSLLCYEQWVLKLLLLD